MILISSFREREIQQAVWEYDGSKSIIPDEFNFNFINIIGRLYKKK